VHPTGSLIARLGTIAQGQGHATTFAQIPASERGIPAEKITIEEGDTDTAPYELGTYGSRSTPVAGAARAMAGRKIRAKAQMIVAPLAEVHDHHSLRNGVMASATASGNSSWIASLPVASRVARTLGRSASASISARDFGGVSAP
jgi:CO/xanthine dehydrogenase Mo-binding subunit